MSDADRERWDARYRSGLLTQAPAAVLTANRHLLPAGGRALDLACGLGANALVLAAAGLDTHAWDVSPVAIGQLDAHAAAAGLTVHSAVRDVLLAPPPPASFDVIVVARFLDRALCPVLAAALRPGGLLFYETFTRLARGGPANPDWSLAENELLALFAGLAVRLHRDDWDAGDPALGLRGFAQFVGQRPRAAEAPR